MALVISFDGFRSARPRLSIPELDVQPARVNAENPRHARNVSERMRTRERQEDQSCRPHKQRPDAESLTANDQERLNQILNCRSRHGNPLGNRAPGSCNSTAKIGRLGTCDDVGGQHRRFSIGAAHVPLQHRAQLFSPDLIACHHHLHHWIVQKLVQCRPFSFGHIPPPPECPALQTDRTAK